MTPIPSRRGGTRARSAGPARYLGWLAAFLLLVHGWLPILLQVLLLASAPAAYGHGHHAGRAADVPAGKSPQCPLFHSAICLCATFAKVLPPPSAPAATRGPAFEARRRRWPRQRPAPQRRQLRFDPRAPPAST